MLSIFLSKNLYAQTLRIITTTIVMVHLRSIDDRE